MYVVIVEPGRKVVCRSWNTAVEVQRRHFVQTGAVLPILPVVPADS